VYGNTTYLKNIVLFDHLMVGMGYTFLCEYFAIILYVFHCTTMTYNNTKLSSL